VGRPVSGAVRKFKSPLKKTQPFSPCSRAPKLDQQRVKQMGTYWETVLWRPQQAITYFIFFFS